MKVETWPRIRELFERALDLPATERTAFVERESNDLDVRREVLRLLGASSTGFEILTPPSAASSEQARPWQPRAGERVGSFTVLRELGSGGMGTVFEARQERPTRTVALKMMHARFASSDARRRFEAEAEILARLRHPGIAAIYELGVQAAPDGSDAPFIAMELVEGARDIVRFAREERLALHALIELFREVCAAVQHAHQKGVIHRDLKPGNVLVDAHGRPKLIDYGIARVVEPDFASAARTRAGDVFGTLAYMSPEQLSGARADIDTRSDVYALGVILYELLARRLPFELAEKPLVESIAAICERTPEPPSRYAPELARELDWIVLRALEKQPARRYASASELADDLGRVLHDEPVLAAPPSRSYRAVKFIARYRVLVIASALVVCSLVAGLGFALHARGVAETRRIEAELARSRADVEAENARVALRRQTAIVDAVGQLIASAQPDGRGRAVTVFELLERKRAELDVGIDDDPELRAAFQFFLVRAYYSLGEVEPAAQLAESALAALEHVPDADPYLRVKLNDWLASLRITQNRLEEAGELLQASEAARDADPETSVADRLYARRAEAMLLEANGRLNEATAAFRELAQLAVDELAYEDPLAPMAWADLATLLMSNHELAEAELLARQAHARALDALGPDSPYTAIIAMRLGNVLRAGRKLEEALSLQRRVVDQMSELFGDAHTNTLQALVGLAHTLAASGELEEAEQIARRALELFVEHHVDDSFELEAEARATLASILGDRGDRAGQVAEIRAAIECFEERGATHQPHLVELYTWLAALELAADRAQAAEELARRAVELGQEHLAPEDPLLAKARARLGRARLRLGRAAEAESELVAAHAALSRAARTDFQIVAREVIDDLVAVSDALGKQSEHARYAEMLQRAIAPAAKKDP